MQILCQHGSIKNKYLLSTIEKIYLGNSNWNEVNFIYNLTRTVNILCMSVLLRLDLNRASERVGMNHFSPGRAWPSQHFGRKEKGINLIKRYRVYEFYSYRDCFCVDWDDSQGNQDNVPDKNGKTHKKFKKLNYYPKKWTQRVGRLFDMF